MTAWFIRFELCDPIPDEQMVAVRQHLLDTLSQAGFPAKSTTAEWAMIELARKPQERFRERGVESPVPSYGRGTRIA